MAIRLEVSLVVPPIAVLLVKQGRFRPRKHYKGPKRYEQWGCESGYTGEELSYERLSEADASFWMERAYAENEHFREVYFPDVYVAIETPSPTRLFPPQ